MLDYLHYGGFFAASLVILCLLKYIRMVKLRSVSRDKIVVSFIHLDLGIGGAERLVVDAACALQDKGHIVQIYTTNHPDRCFPETKELLKVQVHGYFIPHQIFGSFQIVCSILRMCYVAFKLALFVDEIPDVIFCDGVSACIPILKLVPKAKIMFYCHYPDQLLTRKKSFLRSIYRIPMDLLEELTTGMADVLIVNSNFTKSVFEKTFRRIATKPKIIYPCANVKKFDEIIQSLSDNKDSLLKLPTDNRTYFLSINRFDPNKKITLGLAAFSLFLDRVTKNNNNKSYQLILAGGYDPSVPDNVNYLAELKTLAEDLNLKYELLSKADRTKRWSDAAVIFLTDITELQKVQLLKSSLALLYTPSNEHFGIVPVEAMLSQCPVIAVNNGGLLETVTTDKSFGWLCNSDPTEFCDAMYTWATDRRLAKETGERARERAAKNFDIKQLGTRLDGIVRDLVVQNHNKKGK